MALIFHVEGIKKCRREIASGGIKIISDDVFASLNQREFTRWVFWG
jgi:hypothetical protein